MERNVGSLYISLGAIGFWLENVYLDSFLKLILTKDRMRTNFLASSKSPDIFGDSSQAGFVLKIRLER